MLAVSAVRLCEAWAAFTSRFVIRQSVPVYSGAYQTGWRVIATPNLPAIEAYRRQLEALDSSSMTDQQKRDLLLIRMAKANGIFPSDSGEAASTTRAIKSQIDGDFDGWEGDTIVELTNGQIWKQDDFHIEYHFAFMPKVLVYKDGSSWKMHVDGCRKDVKVRQLD